jgi:hypothetical protein
MSDHCAEYELETLLLAPETLTEGEREKIQSHCEGCLLCSEHLANLRQFYNDLEENAKSRPTERDTAFAHDLLSKRRLSLAGRKLELTEKSDSLAESFAEIIEPYRGPLVRRFIRYIQIHPIRFAAASSLSVAAIVLALTTIHPSRDTNPSYARAKDEFLIVYNSTGEELWKKHIGGHFDDATYESTTSASRGPERFRSVLDIDGDGKNEVLSIYSGTGGTAPFDNTLLCYNPDGSERWRYTLDREMTFGSIAYNDSYRFYTLAAGNFGEGGKSEVVAAAGHFPWLPSDIVRLNGNDGTLISEFWHPGALEAFAKKKIQGGSGAELVFGGKNGLFGQAALLVMDPRQVEGLAPMPDSSKPKGIGPGSEKYYVLFPGSDIQQFWNDPAVVDEINLASDGTLEVIVDEKTTSHPDAQIHFIFDSTFSCIRVSGSNTFTWVHDEYKKEGKVSSVLDDRYFEELRKKVEYWDGDRFVNKVAMNKHYLETIKSRPLP